MHNWIGIVISFLFVFGVLGVAQALLALKFVAPPISRKLVHIGVSHWWLIALPLFDSVAFALVGPVAFIVLNAVSIRTELFAAMEAPKEPGKPFNLGTVYFPVSLLALVLITFLTDVPTWIGGLGILILGWGDGMAAIVGMTGNTRHFTVFRQRKSVRGSLAMFSFSFLVSLIYCYIHLPISTGEIVLAAAATAAVATFVEASTPLGLDNLTVPILTSLFFYGVFL